MSKSPVTEYFIEYLKRHHISADETAQAIGIDPQKLAPGYQEPLDSEEFLELCFYLAISPEQVAQGIREKL